MAEYTERVRPYAPEARWARVEGLHVTLKFLGEVNESKLPEIKAALSILNASPFDVGFQSVGFFPNARSARVFWIGVQPDEALPQLAAAIDHTLEEQGFAREQRPYSPHLTLARAGAPGSLRGLAPLLEHEGPPQFGTMTAREFFLFQSHLGKGGSRYTKLEKFSLS
jgi:2'-5' RNA ligase